jgi:hypothetical protein
MTVYLIGGKPYISVSNGYQPIDPMTYYMMIEENEIDRVEEVYND